METKTIKILKKNRKYFACTVNGYKCRLMIDDNSKDLEIGEHELLVNDKSVYSKYGTDLIYELAVSSKEQKNAGIVTLKHFMYNQLLIDQCHDLGGKWDAEEKVWVFSAIVGDKVEELDEIFNSKLLVIEATAIDEIRKGKGPIRLFGYTVARAWGRDSGAKLGDGISLLQGAYDSGGSIKNWNTTIYEGAVIRMKVPEKLFERYEYSKWSFKVLGGDQ